MTPQELLEAYRLAYKEAAYPTIEQMRNAITAVYGDNNIGNLNDDGYVMRKFNAGLRGARGAMLRQYAFNPPRQASTQPAMASHNWVNAHGGNMIAPNSQQVIKAPSIPGYGIGGTPKAKPSQAPRVPQRPYRQPTAYQSNATSPNQAAMDAQRAWIAQQRQKSYNRALAYRNHANNVAMRRNVTPSMNQAYRSNLKKELGLI